MRDLGLGFASFALNNTSFGSLFWKRLPFTAVGAALGGTRFTHVESSTSAPFSTRSITIAATCTYFGRHDHNLKYRDAKFKDQLCVTFSWLGVQAHRQGYSVRIAYVVYVSKLRMRVKQRDRRPACMLHVRACDIHTCTQTHARS